jgi:hypothetical protein
MPALYVHIVLVCWLADVSQLSLCHGVMHTADSICHWTAPSHHFGAEVRGGAGQADSHRVDAQAGRARSRE